MRKLTAPPLLLNWGMLPIRTEEKLEIPLGSYLLVRNVWEVVDAAPCVAQAFSDRQQPVPEKTMIPRRVFSPRLNSGQACIKIIKEI